VTGSTSLPLGRPARVGIVGLGQVYELTIRGYRDNPDTEIVALCDQDSQRLAQRGAEWPDARRFTDYDAFLQEDLDVVEVLVPTPLHCDIVCAALDAGHHVNVQKPFAHSLAEADRMPAARDAAGTYLRVMENFIHYDPLRVLKQVVDSGEIGEPAGFPMKMVATGVGGWDITFAPDMLMKSDYYTNDERFEVTGRKGFVRVNRCTSLGIQQAAVEVYRDGELRAYHALDDDWASSFDTQTREFYRFLVHGGPEAAWNGDEARDVLAFVQAAYDSSEQNRPVRI